LINSDPDWFWHWHTDRGTRGFFTPEAMDDYLTCFRDPETVRAICEDYRAGAGIDCDHDQADKTAGRRITCPMLVLWGAKARLEQWYDTLAVWREWADDVRGHTLPCGHYLPEECPAETELALRTFFSGSP
jgi:haloacetate dehalogenase